VEMPQFSPCGNAKRIYTSRSSTKEEKYDKIIDKMYKYHIKKANNMANSAIIAKKFVNANIIKDIIAKKIVDADIIKEDLNNYDERQTPQQNTSGMYDLSQNSNSMDANKFS
jgi:hypothetical protein